jgi:hypothetical protein
VADPAEPEKRRDYTPYGCMERVSVLVSGQPGGRYRRQDVMGSIQARYGTKDREIKQAVTLLLEDGYLAADGSWLVHSRPYLQPGDPGLDGLVTRDTETIDASYGRSTRPSTMI